MHRHLLSLLLLASPDGLLSRRGVDTAARLCVALCCSDSRRLCCRLGAAVAGQVCEQESTMVRAGGVEPPQALLPYGFSYQLRLSPPRFRATGAAAGLWSGLSLRRGGDLHPRFRRCPSSLYTFPCRPASAVGLGSGLPSDRFPRIWAVLHFGFPRKHSRSAQVRCVYQFRHARVTFPRIKAGQPPAKKILK